jgi:hypothetical protein
MYHSELLVIIRKIVADNAADIAHLPDLALIACREIERLASELDRERLRNNRGSYKPDNNPWK